MGPNGRGSKDLEVQKGTIQTEPSWEVNNLKSKEGTRRSSFQHVDIRQLGIRNIGPSVPMKKALLVESGTEASTGGATGKTYWRNT